jgi:hypothetical protein
MCVALNKLGTTDRRGYEGVVSSTAHELGHMLGFSQHDTTPNHVMRPGAIVLDTEHLGGMTFESDKLDWIGQFRKNKYVYKIDDPKPKD